jgi:hypothetical protein
MIVLVFIKYSCESKKYENFNTSNTIKQVDSLSWFTDPMFLILNYFENDEGGLTGWEKCKLACDGNCVEYGITGNTFCYDRETEDVLNFPTFRDENVNGGFKP